MLRTTQTILCLVILTLSLGLAGCTERHYRVTDLNTGSTYETRRYERLDNGAITFKTFGGNIVTIQNSSIETIRQGDN